MHHLSTLLLLSTTLTLTLSTSPPNTNTTTSTLPAAFTTALTPPSAASLAADNLPGGTAHPSLTLYMYGDDECTSINSSFTTLINALPLSYNVPSPQYPFQAFIMTRNLTGSEMLTFYSSSNTSTEACAEQIGNLTARDGGAGYCLPSWGATCFNLTQG